MSTKTNTRTTSPAAPARTYSGSIESVQGWVVQTAVTCLCQRCLVVGPTVRRRAVATLLGPNGATEEVRHARWESLGFTGRFFL